MTQIPAAKLPGGGSMPLLGFGTWQIKGAQCYDAVRKALDVGYRHLDTATVYRNEEEVGRALADSGLPREEVFVTTKVPPSARDPRGTLEDSLRRLGTDFVDLWLIHWTEGGGVHEELWQALLDAQQAGEARDVGVSNYSMDQIDRLVDATGRQPAVNQIEWAPTLYDEEVARLHEQRGILLEGYSALKNTDLDDPVLREVAEAHGVTTAQVLLRWHLDHGFVAIPKSVTPERIEANFAISGFSLTEEELHRIDGLARAGGDG
jgi:2,5-diketo-D-gluconate reductase A